MFYRTTLHSITFLLHVFTLEYLDMRKIALYVCSNKWRKCPTRQSRGKMRQITPAVNLWRSLYAKDLWHEGRGMQRGYRRMASSLSKFGIASLRQRCSSLTSEWRMPRVYWLSYMLTGYLLPLMYSFVTLKWFEAAKGTDPIANRIGNEGRGSRPYRTKTRCLNLTVTGKINCRL